MSSPSVADGSRLAIFDLDGTVWDSAPGIFHCFRHTLAEFCSAVPADDALLPLLGPPLLVALGELGIPDDELERARDIYRAEYRQIGEHLCEPYEGIVELLDQLRCDGWALATATSKGVEPARRMLAAFDLIDRFDVIAAASMTASSHSKVDVIAEALDRAGNPPPSSTLMIGDRKFDIEGGQHFSLGTVGVTWGYAPGGELEAAKPTHLVDTIAALRELLGSFGPV